MGKLRLQEAKWLTQGHSYSQLVTGTARIQPQVSLIQKPMFFMLPAYSKHKRWEQAARSWAADQKASQVWLALSVRAQPLQTHSAPYTVIKPGAVLRQGAFQCGKHKSGTHWAKPAIRSPRHPKPFLSSEADVWGSYQNPAKWLLSAPDTHTNAVFHSKMAAFPHFYTSQMRMCLTIKCVI